MTRTSYNTILLRDRMQGLVHKHGSLRAAAAVLKLDHAYVSRLCSGAKCTPNDSLLKRLGLIRAVTFIDDGSMEK